MLKSLPTLHKCLSASPKSLSGEELDMLASAFNMYAAACDNNGEFNEIAYCSLTLVFSFLFSNTKTRHHGLQTASKIHKLYFQTHYFTAVIFMHLNSHMLGKNRTLFFTFNYCTRFYRRCFWFIYELSIVMSRIQFASLHLFGLLPFSREECRSVFTV